MAQLNVLPVNVSKNIDTKDDLARLNVNSSKDDFAQHIDLHLTNNKGGSHDDSKTNNDHADANVAVIPRENNQVKADDNDQPISEEKQSSPDNRDTASATQKVATSGKHSDQEPSKEPNNEVIDEPELLMSFLTKADQALIDDGSSENINFNHLSPEQKAHYEAQLLLKSSNLVADLSSISKALQENTGEGIALSSEQEKVAKALLSLSEKNHTSPELKQLSTDKLVNNDLVDAAKVLTEAQTSEGVVEPLTTDEALDKNNSNKAKAASHTKIASDELLSNEKNKLNQQLNAEKLAQTHTANLANENKSAASAQQPTGANDASILAQLHQQKILSENNNAEPNNDKLTAQSAEQPLATSKVSTHGDASLEMDAKTSEKNAQLAASALNKAISNQEAANKGASAKPENSLASTMVTPDNTKKSSATHTSKVSAEPSVKQAVSVVPQTQLSEKSAEQLIEQNKANSSDTTKENSNKTLLNTSTNFSVNNHFTEGTSRAAQATRDIIDQQVAEVFNPTGSAEVAQSQKTNTQLHHETISIFRKDFADAVKDKVMLVISQKLQQFEITLDPPEFGNMQVRVNMQGEQASVNFIVQNQQAKEAFEQNMHKLKDLLAEQGVDVGDANVEQQSDNNSNHSESSTGGEHSTMANTADASDVIEHNLSAQMINPSTTAVDYYA